MKRWLQMVLAVIFLLMVAVAVGAVKMLGPRAFLGPRARPLSAQTFERTPARLARGKYIVEGEMDCQGCHSPHDWTKHDAPTPPGMELADRIWSTDGLPGHVVAPNLTPDPETGSGNWRDRHAGPCHPGRDRA